jgi:hypothetical protein
MHLLSMLHFASSAPLQHRGVQAAFLTCHPSPINSEQAPIPRTLRLLPPLMGFASVGLHRTTLAVVIPAALVKRGDVVAGLCDLAVCMALAACNEQHPAGWSSLWLHVSVQHLPCLWNSSARRSCSSPRM